MEIPKNQFYINFSPIYLQKSLYFIDLQLTFINNNILEDASLVIELFAKINNENIKIGNSSYTWYGKNNGNDIHSGYQTVFIKGILDINEDSKVEFYTKSISQKHCVIVSLLKDYPALLRIS
jgi:hypothetical protein